MGIDSLARLLILVGIGIVILGALLFLLSRLPFLGHLPGDITIRRDEVSCFFPIVTSIILSIILTILLNILIRFFNR